MYCKKINLGLINQVNEFVNYMMFNCNAETTLVKSGNYIVDARSLMGIFSLDLSKPVNLEIKWNDGSTDDEFISKFEEFCKEKGINY